MSRFATDENVNGNIISGILRALPDVDLVSVIDFDLAATPDPIILDWAARERRVLITHDFDTMPGFARDRLDAGLVMPGLIMVPSMLPVTKAVQDLVLMLGASLDDEWENQVRYLPLR